MWAQRREAEVVLASRYLRGGRTELSPPAWLTIHLMNRSLRRTLHLPCHDPTSGIVLYRTSALQEIGIDPLDACGRSPLEILVKLHNRGFKIREVAYHEGAGRSFTAVLGETAGLVGALPRLAGMRRSADVADSEDIAFDTLLPWRRRRLEQRQRTIVGFLEADVPVLDVGCGSSRLIQSLSKGTGLDRDRRKLRFLRGRAKAMVAGELPRLPFRDGSFPQVVCSDVIGSLPPSTPFLPELRRVLRSRGTLVLATGRKRSRAESLLREELQKSGFAVDEVRRLPGRELVIRALRKDL
ncbi:MAG: methyltransferase domain-containing protein [Vicinamibacteria bacterium]